MNRITKLLFGFYTTVIVGGLALVSTMTYFETQTSKIIMLIVGALSLVFAGKFSQILQDIDEKLGVELEEKDETDEETEEELTEEESDAEAVVEEEKKQ